MLYTRSLLLSSGLVLFMLFQSAAAQNLCSNDCVLVIDFIDGGSIEAVEPLVITFGEGGFIQDDSVTTGYARNEQLTLGAGEIIQFNSGGVLNLGDSGNIDYSSMNFIVNGNVTITALNDGSISMHGDSVFSVTGTLQVNSDLNVGAELNISESNGTSGSNIADLITGSGSITVATTGSIVNTATLETVYVNTQAPLFPDNLTLITEDNQTGLENITIATANDSTCTIQDGQCADLAGEVTIDGEGQLAVEKNSSGSMTLYTLLCLLSLFMLYRGRYRS